ncbi:MAG: putative bifunctional SAT/APS kinase [Chlamydiia bacterium]|nr:putative bifunctional SAT/APS kinase [Chlamydiia bacterium]
MKRFFLSIVFFVSIFSLPYCLSEERGQRALIQESSRYKSVILNERQLCDLEMLLCGGFSPLNTFLGEEDYKSVVENCRLCDGNLWPIPVVLSVEESVATKLQEESYITLRGNTGMPLAIMKLENFYKPCLKNECKKVYGTLDTNHPYVSYLNDTPKVINLSGELRKVMLPYHYDNMNLRLTPKMVKDFIKEQGWKKIIGFQTRNPLHRCHEALLLNAASSEEDKVLLHPVVGYTQNADIDPGVRVRCYKKFIEKMPKDKIKLALLPLSMRMAGPREALWHALIRKNYGCTHFIIGRDHAGPSLLSKDSKPFYEPYEAHEFVKKHESELGISIITSKELAYIEELGEYRVLDDLTNGYSAQRLSGTEVRRRLANNLPIPSWFSYPEIISELRPVYKKKKGFCVYFVGLSASGKSTLAKKLETYLKENDPLLRSITLLDGDVVRKNLSKGLGFSKKDRMENIKRIGYVASLVVKSGGICICSNIAPYEEARRANRKCISNEGGFLEVFVNTPIDVCRERDPKGLYALAEEGVLKNMTGVSDPFEIPRFSEVVLDNTGPIEDSIESIVSYLKKGDLL